MSDPALSHSSSTRLVIRYRVVPERAAASYRRCWDDLAAAARQYGARAWVFQSAGEPGRYIEFVEYDVLQEAALRAGTMLAESSLEKIAASTPAGTWDEWKV